MKKYLKHLSIACLLFIGTSATAAPTQKSVTIGIVLPVAVPALTQIVNGFEETMTQQSKVPVHYSVKNAEGDASMQRSILQEFANDSDVTLVAPIGTDAAQMAIAVVRNKPIVAIAADHVKSEAQKANNLNVTGVNSRVPPAKRMQLIHAAIPSLKKITIIYSASSIKSKNLKLWRKQKILPYNRSWCRNFPTCILFLKISRQIHKPFLF